MAALALIAAIYFIVTGLRGKGKAFTSKMGTPLSEKEAKAVKFTYLIVGVLLIVVAAVSGVQLLID